MRWGASAQHDAGRAGRHASRRIIATRYLAVIVLAWIRAGITLMAFGLAIAPALRPFPDWGCRPKSAMATAADELTLKQHYRGSRMMLKCIRQLRGRVSDRDFCTFRKGLSVRSGRCSYLHRLTSPKSSGRRFEAASPGPSSRGQRLAVGGRGGTRATCSTESYGCCAPELRGPICRAAIRRTRRVTTASRSGSARESWTESSPLSSGCRETSRP